MRSSVDKRYSRFLPRILSGELPYLPAGLVQKSYSAAIKSRQLSLAVRSQGYPMAFVELTSTAKTRRKWKRSPNEVDRLNALSIRADLTIDIVVFRMQEHIAATQKIQVDVEAASQLRQGPHYRTYKSQFDALVHRVRLHLLSPYQYHRREAHIETHDVDRRVG
jgi:hypothetical protein